MREPSRLRVSLLACWVAVAFLGGLEPCQAQELEPVALPEPQKTGGKGVLQALAERQTTRAFTDRELPPQVLSNLLWAAFGVNRTEAERAGLGRTAPSAMNLQEVDLYVALREGVYLYEAEPHRLRPVVAGDLPADLGPPAASEAALTIVYVADLGKVSTPGRGGGAGAASFSDVNTGFIGQNVYLFATSEGLGAWFRGGIPDAESLRETLELRRDQHILYVQTVGYPAGN